MAPPLPKMRFDHIISHMKNISISLTDQHAAEIDAQIASGDYASVSEVVRAALREFLSRGATPDGAQIDRDIADYLEGQARGQALTSGAEARHSIRDMLNS